MRGPLKLIKDGWLEKEPPFDFLNQVRISDLQHRLTSAWEVKSNIKTVQGKLNTWYN